MGSVLLHGADLLLLEAECEIKSTKENRWAACLLVGKILNTFQGTRGLFAFLIWLSLISIKNMFQSQEQTNPTSATNKPTTSNTDLHSPKQAALCRCCCHGKLTPWLLIWHCYHSAHRHKSPHFGTPGLLWAWPVVHPHTHEYCEQGFAGTRLPCENKHIPSVSYCPGCGKPVQHAGTPTSSPWDSSTLHQHTQRSLWIQGCFRILTWNSTLQGLLLNALHVSFTWLRQLRD